MTAFMFGAAVTYIIAPLVVYLYVSRILSGSACTPLQSAAVSLSLGPMGISLLLFFLFHLLPGRSDTFYVTFVISSLAALGLVGILLFRRYLPRLALPTDQLGKLTADAKRLTLWLYHSPEGLIFVSMGRLGLLGVTCYLVASFSSPLNFSFVVLSWSLTAALLYAVVGFLALLEVLYIFAILRTISEQPDTAATRSVPWLLSLEFLRRGISGWTVVVTLFVLSLLVYQGLTRIIIDNDPIEYAMAARAIYYEKSLAIYPMVIGLSESGYQSSTTHPPALNMSHVWGYMFDGPTSTRFLRLSSLFYYSLTLLTLYAFLRPYGYFAAILAPALLATIPYYAHLATVSHVDPLRIQFFFLSLCLVASIVKQPTAGLAALGGVVWGFTIYTHALGVFSIAIVGAALFMADRRDLSARLRFLLMMGLLALAVGGWQYFINIATFGVPLHDYQPVWSIPQLFEAEDMAYRRRIGSLFGILFDGLLQNFTQPAIFGYVQLASVVIMLAGARLLWKTDLGRVMLLGLGIFFACVTTLLLIGSLAAVKNIRYMMTIAPVLCCGAALVLGQVADRFERTAQASAGVFNELSAELRQTRLARFYLVGLVTCVTGLAVANAGSLRNAIYYYSNPRLVWLKEDRKYIYDPRYGFGEIMRYFARNPPKDEKVLAFRQADFAFFGTGKWVHYLDPVLVDFFGATDKNAAYEDLLARKVRYFFVPGYLSQPTAYYNSQAIEIAADPMLSEIVVASDGGWVFRLRDAPTPVECAAISPAEVQASEVGPRGVERLVRRVLLGRSIGVTKSYPFNPERVVEQAAGQPGLARVTLSGIDVSEGARSPEAALGTRRLHMEIELIGEGIAVLSLLSQSSTGASPPPIGLWSGLLRPQGKTVRIQTVIPPTVGDLTIIAEKLETHVGTLSVGSVRLCVFRGPPT